jgi:hypothetical protein
MINAHLTIVSNHRTTEADRDSQNRYGIRDLKALAKKKFAAQSTAHRESAEFAASLSEVYDGTVEKDRGLRDVVVSTFRRFPELAQRADVEEVVRDTPGLAWELFRVAWGLPV